ncbi:exo-alpha-sialidase, partial [Candidatus Dependentiae bacterium]|nr:exo-alpha-sialidase [Candidatus Dependentiae bacterium]
MIKYSSFLLAGALLLSIPAFVGAKQPISVQIKNKEIGFKNNPNRISTECLLAEAIPGRTTIVHYNSPVESFLAVNPQNACQAVAVWQQDRISNGGALDIGIAHTEDGGKSWSDSTIPFQNCNGGFTARSSDVWVSHSADGKKVYIGTLHVNAVRDPNTQNQAGITVTFSEDNGKNWSNPHFVIAATTPLAEAVVIDKPSITADPVVADNVYMTWDSFISPISGHSDTWFARTTNGGLSWEDSRLIYNPFLDPGLKTNDIPEQNQTINNIVVGLPNGDLLCFTNRLYAPPGTTEEQWNNDVFPFQFLTSDIACIRSTDKGVTWSQTATQIAVGDANNDF